MADHFLGLKAKMFLINVQYFVGIEYIYYVFHDYNFKYDIILLVKILGLWSINLYDWLQIANFG